MWQRNLEIKLVDSWFIVRRTCSCSLLQNKVESGFDVFIYIFLRSRPRSTWIFLEFTTWVGVGRGLQPPPIRNTLLRLATGPPTHPQNFHRGVAGRGIEPPLPRKRHPSLATSVKVPPSYSTNMHVYGGSTYKRFFSRTSPCVFCQVLGDLHQIFFRSSIDGIRKWPPPQRQRGSDRSAPRGPGQACAALQYPGPWIRRPPCDAQAQLQSSPLLRGFRGLPEGLQARNVHVSTQQRPKVSGPCFRWCGRPRENGPRLFVASELTRHTDPGLPPLKPSNPSVRETCCGYRSMEAKGGMGTGRR
jgi:hypothetical protein